MRAYPGDEPADLGTARYILVLTGISSCLSARSYRLTTLAIPIDASVLRYATRIDNGHCVIRSWSQTHAVVLHQVCASFVEYRRIRSSGGSGKLIVWRSRFICPCLIRLALRLAMLAFSRLIMAQVADVSFDAAFTRSILRHAPKGASC